ncbi:MAG: hypothetical protein DMD25_05665 [Gemmatimonadetes bacterium]|nr:MAG: hypothetical protein DMD57_09775 [Gemmatimonadota bacterium]PYP05001.1 MAG: hypothetical protein DMD27_08395 [Gemmatimonadota bacterium]PYP13599.1 MAG: hypothetical protein DMD56_00035 [Gemmatimonadota bacterium]PYP79236.1 MAG: hypothetical protein DMD25_05665 [Gemmatimonadota bacterium]
MVAPRSLARAATVLVTIGACRGGASGAKITLRYHPPTGAAYHYSLDQQNAMRIVGGPMSALPEQTFRMRMYYTQVVKGPAQGGVAVTVTFDSTSLDAPGMGPGAMRPALDRMRGMRSDVVYDDRMHVLSAAFTGLTGAPSPVTEQLGSSMKSMAFPLPEGPVGVGDSWVAEHELPLGHQALNASGPLKSRTKITVREIQIAGADTSVLLGIETSFPEAPITLMQRGEGGAQQTGTLRLSGNLSGEQLYSLQRSAQVRAMMGGTITMKTGTTGQPEMTMAMTQQTSLQLTEAK